MTKTEDRATDMMKQLEGGSSFRAVASEFGVTHERVRQVVKAKDPEFLDKLKSKRESARRDRAERRERERIEALEAKRGKCRICGASIPASRPSKYTCSPEHQVIWNKIRFHIDPELRHKHRISQARAIQSSETPDTYSESQIAWAKAVLSDDPPPLKPPTFTNDKTGEVRKTYEQWKRDHPALARRVEAANASVV